MSIENGAGKDVTIQVPGLREGIYVDPSLRSERASTDVASDDADDEEVADHLKLLGYGPSSIDVDAVVTDIHQLFGADPDDRDVTRFLSGADGVSLADLNHSELVMAGVHPADLSRRELVLAPQGVDKVTGRLAVPTEVDPELLALQLELQQSFSVRPGHQI